MGKPLNSVPRDYSPKPVYTYGWDARGIKRGRSYGCTVWSGLGSRGHSECLGWLATVIAISTTGNPTQML